IKFHALIVLEVDKMSLTRRETYVVIMEHIESASFREVLLTL
ncbi:unnamed protein product, partial [Leptidea sinapis]